MARMMNEDDVEYLKAVSKIINDYAGVTFASILHDLRATNDAPLFMSELRTTLKPDEYAKRVIDKLNLAPKGDFDSDEDAKAMNLRRAAFVALTEENQEWAVGTKPNDDAIFRSLEDDRVVKLGVVRSTNQGTPGFAVSVSDTATLDLKSDGSNRCDIRPPDAEFVQMSVGLDITDALSGYDKILESEETATLGMR